MSKTILILEDDIVFRRTLSHSLFKKGFSCIEANTLKQSISALNSLEVDLVVIDQGLQEGQRGLDFLKAATEKKIPSILVTAFPDEQIFEQAWTLGAYEVMAKPVAMSLLIDTIIMGCEVGAAEPTSQKSTKSRTDKITQTSFDTIPIMNESLIGQLTALITRNELIDIHQNFISQVEEDITNIKSGIKQKDFSKAQEASHRLAGAMLNLGLLRCEAIGRALQIEAINESPNCHKLIPDLECSKNESLSKLQDYIDKSVA